MKKMGIRQGFKKALFCIMLSLVLVGTGFSAEEYEMVDQWGGPQEDLLDRPTGMAVDAQGSVYVADLGKNCIKKFAANGTELMTINPPAGIETFKNPVDVKVDADGNIYVLDTWYMYINKFDGAGNFIKRWRNPEDPPIQTGRVNNLAVDKSAHVYATVTTYDDTYSVLKFDSAGAFITGWGPKGTADGEFSFAGGIGVDSKGSVYVADSARLLIQKFDSAGAFIAKWGGEQGVEPGQFRAPAYIAVDSSDNIYVADASRLDIQKFSSTGTFITSLAKKDIDDINPGIAVGPDGSVYASNQDMSRILKYQLKTGDDGDDGNDGGDDGGNDGGTACPAIAALGANSAELTRLRAFRDEILAANAAGRLFIRMYYASGPYLCGVMEQHPAVKTLLRRALQALSPAIAAAAR